ncbi:hypothetical protein HF680_15215 [Brevundimonas sp. WCHBH090558]|uniref:hypothetical protein n=1 Tax=Brevundimonas huaxiensis TaxID=2725493 RepID=UPI00162AC4A9|nr:hypothetical protein [Brevundimonas huaxiensis]MBC1183991.1 hypothetical protein [Brevundimonas huaxiensis]
MSSGILHNLAQATHKTANHHDAAFRFWMGVGLLCGLSLQNDYDGIFIATDAVADFNLTGTPWTMDVPLVRNASGAVIDILHEEAGYAGHTWVEVAREIALTTDPEVRLVAIEAATLRMVVDGDDRLEDLLEKLMTVRRDGLGVEALDPSLSVECCDSKVIALSLLPR